MAKKKIVSLIILSWNTKNLTKECLKSIGNLKSSEIIVVDNGSNDGSPEMIKKEFPRVILIKNKKNLGFGAANNQGMKKAKGDYFLILNSDTVVKNKAPLKMAQFLERHPQTGAVGCKLLNPDGTDQPSFGPFPNLLVSFVMLFAEHWLGGHLVRRSSHEIEETDWVMGAALMIKKEVFAKAGPMDESIFMYLDEVEWCYRIKKAGFKVMFYPEAKIVHLGRGSSKTGKKDPIINIYRGLRHFYQKHYPDWQFLILRLMLKLKAAGALSLGYLTNKQYLKETYGQAFRIA